MSDPKLIEARDRIRAILEELDIAAHVVLHNAPGNLEVMLRLDPSWSCLSGQPPVIRLRSHKADYGGDVERQRKDLEATLNMVNGIGDVIGQSALVLLNLAEEFNKATGAKHTPRVADGDEQPVRH